MSDPVGDCEALGGTYDENTDPKCTLPSNPQADCETIGGVFNDSTNPKCTLPTNLPANCTALGGVYNANTTPKCTLPSNPQANCAAIGGNFNSSTNKCTLDASSNCTALGGTIVAGKCQIANAPPGNTTDCSTTYGAGWIYDSVLRTCVPPRANHGRGDIAGECVQGPIVPRTPVPPGKKVSGQCTCEDGYTVIVVDDFDIGPEGPQVNDSKTITCMKN